MSIYTIGDLHLSFHSPKPMDIFGEKWEDHEAKIKNNWINTVKKDDLVVLLGDFSWATYLQDTYQDFEYLSKLPGKKLLLKGNHDYWWTTVTKMRNFLKENNFENIDFVYNTAYKFENCIIAGTRGWALTNKPEDEKFIKREADRLELSIKEALKLRTNEEIIVFIHYPPINKEINPFITTMQKYNIKRCYYAHLHGDSIKEAIEGNYFGIDFKLVSADSLNFKLLKID